MTVKCRKCGRTFDWDKGEGYAKEASGYLCSMGCELSEVRSQLAAVTAERDLAIKAIGDAAFALWGNGDHKCAAAEEGLIAKMNELGLNHWGEPSHKETPSDRS